MTVEKLITDHIDTWTTALQTRSTAGRGSSGKIDLYGIKKLRELILELAIRGKLVPQDPNDEPASELLKRIAAEKTELVKQGKIKKQKLLPEISEEEKPFELPVGWEWARINEIGHDWGQKTPDTNFTYIDVSSINKEYGIIEDPLVISAKDAPSRARKVVQKGTVIYSTVRPYLLNIAIVENEISPEPIASTAFAIIHPYTTISANFIYYYLRSPIFINYVESCQAGIAYPAINDKQFFSGLIAIPPSFEQIRITDKVKALMALCDQLEQHSLTSLDAHQQLVETLLTTLTDSKNANELSENWARISEHFDTLFTTEASIEALKQTILQLAVMGKLVPQDPNDEPASELLKRIAQEKAQLVKDGKIKKQKPLPPISDEEKPFELPEGWEWCRLGKCTNLTSGQHLKPDEYEEEYYDEMLPYITGPAEFGPVSPSFSKYTNEKRAIAAEGDVLITCKGAGLGKLNVANTDIAISRQLMAVRAIGVSSSYLKIVLDSMYSYFQSKGVGIAIPGISREDVIEPVIKLPPLKEQQRIINMVSRLYILIEDIKSRLRVAQQTQLQLADTLTDVAIN